MLFLADQFVFREMIKMDQAIGTLCVLAIAAFLFATELVPLAVTAMGSAIVLGIMGVLTTKEVFAGLSNSTVVLFAGMFVIGASMFHTGLAQKIGTVVVQKAGVKENRLMLAIMTVTIILSAVSSNTGTVAALMPVIIGICGVAKLSAPRQLMPLAVAANAGGTITLIGTPPNLIVSGSLQAAGLEPFGFFEFAWIGIPLSIMAILYMMIIGKKLLPKRIVENMVVNDQTDSIKTENIQNKTKMWISGLILLGVVSCMGLNLEWLPLQMAAVAGALLCVLTKCLTEKQAYNGIDWVTIFLFAGMLSVATAMEKSGAGKLVADYVVTLLGDTPSPVVITAALFVLSCGLTQFMSNTAAAALLGPIGISIAQSIGASPYPVLMAIGIAASCAYTTPVATPPNTLVLGPGQFTFMDYVKCGTPLCLLSLIICLVVIPLVWPFFP